MRIHLKKKNLKPSIPRLDQKKLKTSGDFLRKVYSFKVLLALNYLQKKYKLFPQTQNKNQLYYSLFKKLFSEFKYLLKHKVSIKGFIFPIALLTERKRGYAKHLLAHLFNKSFASKTKNRKYGIIRIHTTFTNINISLTTLNGKILKWANGDFGNQKEKKTRMSNRSLRKTINHFLKKIKKRLKLRYIKILFTGPSKRFRRQFIVTIKRKKRRLKFNVLCIAEGFHRSFNGCRLTRKKR